MPGSQKAVPALFWGEHFAVVADGVEHGGERSRTDASQVGLQL